MNLPSTIRVKSRVLNWLLFTVSIVVSAIGFYGNDMQGLILMAVVLKGFDKQ